VQHGIPSDLAFSREDRVSERKTTEIFLSERCFWYQAAAWIMAETNKQEKKNQS